MKPLSAPTTARDQPTNGGLSADWRERSAKLYRELERPAMAMVRRAFRGAFSDQELEDIYASAWVGTLRALDPRHAGLDDDEIRKYLLTAVANQATKELRRRKRKPVAPLDAVGGVADGGPAPEDRVSERESSRVTRDLLTSLPPRRRAVMLLRYGWGLAPSQVCELVGGLSPRAYRKEITRGVDELAERMRRFEQGEWCSDREPLLKAYATGLADSEQARQAKAHLSHCHQCSEFVSRLGGHLHDLGSGIAVPGIVDALDGRISLAERLSDVGDRARDVGERFRDAVGGAVTRGGDAAQELGGSPLAAGGTRGAGVAGAGVLAKLAGIGTAGKIALVCATGGAAATACISASLVPETGAAAGGGEREQAAVPNPANPETEGRAILVLPDEKGEDLAPASAAKPAPEPEPVSEPTVTAEPVEPVEPVESSAPPVAQEFGVAAAAAPTASSGSGGGSSGGDGSSDGGSAVQQEFGP